MVLWYFVMVAAIVVNLKNIHQRITEYGLFYLNQVFSQSPNFFKPQCDCGEMKINV